jgi:flagellar biosynthetic protein FliP
MIVLASFSGAVSAQQSLVQVIEQSHWLDSLAPELKVLFTLTALSFIPALLIATTAFTRIVIVLSLLRQALGLMQTPSNVVIVSLSFFLTWFVMEPVFSKAKNEALIPYLEEQVTLTEAIDKGVSPFREFMISQTREEDFAAVLTMANVTVPATVNEVKTEHLIPAFMLSELRTAFEIAFVIFIPFLLIDLVVASVLMALGMIMVPPISIALPIKIMLFVLIDGWTLVSQSVLASFLT